MISRRCSIALLIVTSLSFLIALTAAHANAGESKSSGVIRSQREVGSARQHNWKEIPSTRRRLRPGAIEMIFALVPVSASDSDAMSSCPEAGVESVDDSPWEGSQQVRLDVEAGQGAGMALLSGPAARRRRRALYGRESEGWLVGYVAPWSGAASAGVEVDDLVVEVNGLTAASARELPAAINGCSKVILTILRRHPAGDPASAGLDPVSLTAPDDR